MGYKGSTVCLERVMGQRCKHCSHLEKGFFKTAVLDIILRQIFERICWKLKAKLNPSY